MWASEGFTEETGDKEGGRSSMRWSRLMCRPASAEPSADVGGFSAVPELFQEAFWVLPATSRSPNFG